MMGRMPFENQPGQGTNVQFNIGEVWKKARQERGLDEKETNQTA